MSKGKILNALTLKLVGATIGSIEFYLIAFNRQILGTALVGIGSVLILPVRHYDRI